MKRLVFALALLLAFALSTPRLVAEEPKPVASVEGLTEYRLENGLRVVLFPDPSSTTATVNIVYLVGSRHEAYGETGMAHLLEHLVFKGTPKHLNIPKELSEHGAQANGTTSLDRTNYYETVPATEENILWALDLESDRMVNSFIAKKDLDSEMTVVRNEMESGENSPQRVLMERIMSTSYLWHNYGKSTIGARSDVEGVPIDRLQGFYRKYYQPDNAVLIVAGKFDPTKVLATVREKFGSIPRPDRSGANFLWPTYTLEPTQDGERAVTLRRAGDVQLVMHCYHVPPGSHGDYAAVEILSQVLGDAPSGRLYKALVEPKKASSSAAFSRQLREAGTFLTYAEVRTEDSLDEADRLLGQTIEALAAAPITAEEVERARTALLKGIDNSINNSARLAIQLTEWAAMGDWRLFFIHRDRLKQVTPGDVQRVALAYLKPSNRTVGKFIPSKEPARAEVPPAPDVAALVKDYKGSAKVVAGEAFDTDPKAIEARVARHSLPNGAKVALLPRQTRGQTVVVSVRMRMGSLDTLRGKDTDAQMVGDMLMRGTTKHTRQQLQDAFDRLKARVMVGNGGGFILTTRENLPETLRLVAEILTQPAFDEKEFSLLKVEQLAQIESVLSEPAALATNALDRHLNPYSPDHPNYTPTLPEQKQRITDAKLDGAKAFHEAFYGGDTALVAVVGDFDAKQTLDLLKESLGSWKAKTAYERIALPHQPVPAEAIVIQTPDKANAVYYSGLPIAMRQDHADYPAMVLANYMMGGGFLNSRLATRIRQKEGLSYSVRSGFSADARDERAMFNTNAIYAPQNVEKLEAAFREEIEKARAEGFSADEVDQAKKGWLEARKNSRSQDPGLASLLVAGLELDRTMLYEAELEAKVAALTPEQINAAFRKHVDPKNITTVKAGDFKAKVVK